MELTACQKAALEYAFEWEGANPLLIQGPAGTGKTWLVDHLVDGRRAAYLSFTGKAVGVLRTKVKDPEPVSFSTIHSAMYAPSIKDPVLHAQLLKALEDAATPEETLTITAQLMCVEADMEWSLRDEFSWEREGLKADVIVVDECSMVPESLGRDMMTLARRGKTPVIAIGDFAQLPPVEEEAYFNPLICDCAPPLDEIVRQAKDSPIINLAWAIRDKPGGRVTKGHQEPGLVTCGFSDKVTIDTPWDHKYDQMICGRNATRHATNAMYRLSGPPRVGDKMIVLKNDHTRRVYNGDIFFVTEVGEGKWIRAEFYDGRTLWLDIHEETDQSYPRFGTTRVGFAYAITCHKSQGSEWRTVHVLDESACFRENASRWLYTAVTRARDTLILRM